MCLLVRAGKAREWQTDYRAVSNIFKAQNHKGKGMSMIPGLLAFLDSATFLDRRSPAYVGEALEFLLSPMITDGFNNLAGAVRKGGTVMPVMKEN